VLSSGLSQVVGVGRDRRVFTQQVKAGRKMRQMGLESRSASQQPLGFDYEEGEKRAIRAEQDGRNCRENSVLQKSRFTAPNAFCVKP
jgi:hypothetical protein